LKAFDKDFQIELTTSARPAPTFLAVSATSMATFEAVSEAFARKVSTFCPKEGFEFELLFLLVSILLLLLLLFILLLLLLSETLLSSKAF